MTAAQAQRQRVRQVVRQQRAARRQRRVAQRQRNRRHNTVAWALKGATEFSSDRVLSNAAKVISLFIQRAPDVCLRLIDKTTPKRLPGGAGAPRMEGAWALVFFAHIMAGNPDWQRWYDDNQSNAELWRACGFTATPAWQTLYLRFAELEHDRYVAAFTEAANHFVRIAAESEPHAFRFFHVDGTPAHSHARLEHACPSEAYCNSRREAKPAKALDRASDEAIADDRHKRSAKPAPDDSPPPGDVEAEEGSDVPPDNKLYKLTDAEAQALDLEDWRKSRYFRRGKFGHILRCRDKHVGVRMYSAGPNSKKKVWVGGYFLPAVDDFHGAPTAVHFFEADIQEHLGWPELYRKLARAVGDDPDRPKRITGIVADRAFTNQPFIEFNSNRGVASITPERTLPGGKPWETLRTDRWDEHSPRCKYCGGPSAKFKGPNEGFVLTGTGDPRIRYRCAIGWTQHCRDKVQTISCREEPRALLPINRRERVFHDLARVHSNSERVFDSWRDRYAVSGTSQATRSKRRLSIQAQKLRAAAALLAEWFRICVRERYIGDHPQGPKREAKPREGGAKRMQRIQAYRSEHMLNLPYGAAAEALQLPAAPRAGPT